MSIYRASTSSPLTCLLCTNLLIVVRVMLMAEIVFISKELQWDEGFSLLLCNNRMFIWRNIFYLEVVDFVWTKRIKMPAVHMPFTASKCRGLQCCCRRVKPFTGKILFKIFKKGLISLQRYAINQKAHVHLSPRVI